MKNPIESNCQLFSIKFHFNAIIEQHSDPDFWGASISVHKGVRDAVRDYNYTLDNWIDTLMDHSTLDVLGADESLKRARSLKHEKLKVREVSRKIRKLLS